MTSLCILAADPSLDAVVRPAPVGPELLAVAAARGARSLGRQHLAAGESSVIVLTSPLRPD